MFVALQFMVSPHIVYNFIFMLTWHLVAFFFRILIKIWLIKRKQIFPHFLIFQELVLIVIYIYIANIIITQMLIAYCYITYRHCLTYMLDNWPGVDWFVVVYRVKETHIAGVPANVTDVNCCKNGGPISSWCFCKTKSLVVLIEYRR